MEAALMPIALFGNECCRDVKQVHQDLAAAALSHAGLG